MNAFCSNDQNGLATVLYCFDSFELDPDRATLKNGDTIVKIEPQVFLLLTILIQKRDEIVSRETLLHEIWQDRNISNNVIDSRIRSARQALGDDGKTQRFIKTYINQGFKFVADVEEKGTAPEQNEDRQQEASETVSNEISPEPVSQTISEPPTASVAPTTSVSQSTAQSPNTLSTSPATPAPPKRLRLVGLSISIAAIALLSAFALTNSRGTKSTPAPPVITNAEEAIPENNVALSIAVLPATNEDIDPDTNQFATAVAEETLAFLAGISNLNVVSRSSSFAFRDKELSTQEINDALGVDYLVESKCRLVGDRAIITVQLVRAGDEIIVWSKRYDVAIKTEERGGQQAAVARNIAQNIANTLGVSASSFSPNIISAAAYQEYTQGLSMLAAKTPEGVDQAIQAFRFVIATEPDYLPAYARLFDAYWGGINYAGLSFDKSVPEMQKLVRQMQVLGPETPEALTAEALLIQFAGDREFPINDILALLQRARAAGPNYALAYEETAHALSAARRYRDAAAAFEEALSLSPVSPELLAGASWVQHLGGDFETAIKTAKKNMRWNPDNIIATTAYARLLVDGVHYVEAHQILSEVLKVQPNNYAANQNMTVLSNRLGLFEDALAHAPIDAVKAYIYALMDDDEKAREYASKFPGYYMSKVALYTIGDDEPLFKYLTSPTYETDEPMLSHTRVLPKIIEADTLRQFEHPRSREYFNKVSEYFAQNPETEFRNVQQYYGAIAFQIYQENLDEAMRLLDAANQKGYIFLHILKTPFFSPLTRHPDFAPQLEAMKKNSERVLAEIRNNNDNNSTADLTTPRP